MSSNKSNNHQQKRSIEKEKVLLVEGRDALEFVTALLKYLKILNAFEVRNFGGVNDFGAYLKAFVVTPGFTRVKSIGIIRDAENNANSAFTSICNDLKRNDLKPPDRPNSKASDIPEVSIFILPDCTNPGMLETLLLNSLRDVPIMKCVDDYFKCLDKASEKGPKNIEKSQIQAYIASKPEYVPHLGLAAHKGYWDWENNAFTDLINFLRGL